ncbi:MAG: hypothetical protein ABIF82_09340 [Planctomycetota bacterium]
MEFLPDWEMSKKRFAAWWQNEMIDRPVVRLSCRREKPRWPLRFLPDVSESSRERYLDPQCAVDAMENALAVTEYFGDCPPQCGRGVNTGYLGSFAGAKLAFRKTVWIEPTVQRWADAAIPRFDPETTMFRNILAVSDALAENSKGRYLLATPDHLDAATTMSQLQGAENMCLALFDDPESVYAYRDQLVKVWLESYDFWRDYDRKKGFEGSANWAGAFSTGRSGVVQSDFSAIISPEMFEDLVKPELAAEGRHLDTALYHWDGPGQIPHTDILLGMPEITAIQWVPGAGSPSAVEFPDPVLRAQAAGKPVQLFCDIDELDAIVEIFDPKGAMLIVSPGSGDHLADAPGACRAAMKKIEAWATKARGA